jgi:hypothetical protein
MGDHQTRGAFPSEEAGMKLLYLALSDVFYEMAAGAALEASHGPVRPPTRLPNSSQRRSTE